MSTARLRIEVAGPLTSVQDAGRPGWRRFGVPPSGPVDRRAFAAALAATGGDGAAIELSLGGVTFVCDDAPVAMAITGSATLSVGDVEVGGWCVVTIPAGARCRVHEVGGNWGYIAFAGVLDATAWLGSRSTHLIAGLGGGKLEAGATIAVAEARGDLASVSIAKRDHGAPITVARVVLGPQQRFFAPDVAQRLTGEPFAASARFDRMGMVLNGPPLSPLRIDMPSEPAVRGALQVDGDGRVSLLTADHQTTGGYPRIGVVIEPDIDRIAQLPAGTPLRFELVEAAAAVEITRALARRDAAWLARVADKCRKRGSLMTANLVDGVVLDGSAG